MAITLRWDITNKCSLNCIHCYNYNERYNVSDITKNKILKIINNIPSKDIKFIKLSGGEPFEFNELSYLTDLLRDTNIDFGITTNGMFKQNYENKKVLLNERLKFITFSLDGCTKEEAQIFRKNVDFNFVIDNIKLVKKIRSDIKIAIILIINKLNYKNIFNILDFYFNNINIDKICLTNLKVTNNKIKELKCSDDEINNVLSQVDNFKINNKNNSKIELSLTCNKVIDYIDFKSDISLDYKCTAGRETGYIDSLGNLLPCTAIAEHISYNSIKNSNEYSLIDNPFWDIWMKEEFEKVYQYDLEYRYSNNIELFRKSECLKCKHREQKCSSCYFRSGEKLNYEYK